MIDDAHLDQSQRGPAAPGEPEPQRRHGVSSRALIVASLVTAAAIAYLLLSTLGGGGGGGDGGAQAVEEGRFLPNRYVTRQTDTIPSVAALHAVDEQAVLDANDREASEPLAPGTVLIIPAAPTEGRSLPAEIEDDPTRLDLLPIFDQWAEEYDVPSDLLKATAWQESRWDESAVSEAGAVGIGQLEPSTTGFIKGSIVTEPLDPEVASDNIRLSAAYLGYLLEQTDGDHAAALAGYLLGPTAFRENGYTQAAVGYITGVMQARPDFAAPR